MRTILSILSSLLLISCANQGFDDIDFLAYSYRQFVSDSPEFEQEVKIVCPIYLHIDNEYNCKLIRSKIYEDTGTYYIEVRKEPRLREIINEIINKSKEFSAETDLRPNHRPAIYDGSDLRIRITKDGKSKLIHFWQDHEASLIFEKLFSYSLILFKRGPYLPIDSLTQRRKQEFVNFVVKSDSIIWPNSLNIPRDFKPKYNPPQVIK
jgi:hypothetical protein